MSAAACVKCGKRLVSIGSTTRTLVGYQPTKAGHLHDDNCVVTTYYCEDGHASGLSRINKCWLCSWTGKTSCFCCVKVAKLPEVPS